MGYITTRPTRPYHVVGFTSHAVYPCVDDIPTRCPSSLVKLVNITPISLWFMVDISILTMVYKPTFPSLGGTTLANCPMNLFLDDGWWMIFRGHLAMGHPATAQRNSNSDRNPSVKTKPLGKWSLNQEKWWFNADLEPIGLIAKLITSQKLEEKTIS